MAVGASARPFRQSWRFFVVHNSIPYRSRVRVDRDYLQALGRAVYNFTYFEWGIISTIAKLSANGFGSVPKGKTANEIAKALTKAIEKTKPPISPALHKRLVKLDESYRDAIKMRNKLFHAHPYSTPDGNQQLGGGGIKWPLAEVNSAARMFEEAAIYCNHLFHGDLKKERS